MNELQIFNYEGREVRTVQRDNESWWVLKDVCDVLEISNSGNVSSRLDDDEKGIHSTDTLGGRQEMIIVNESGLYNVILRSDKPEAKTFKRWVTHEVLPSIRKTGTYTAKSMTDYQRIIADTREKNIRVRSALILERLAGQYDGTYKQVLHAYTTKELTGDFLLPLPRLEAKTYTATEIGQRLGVSANMVGILANRHNLKTEEYGAWFNDKAKGHSKEVQSFRYFECVFPIFQGLISKDTAN